MIRRSFGKTLLAGLAGMSLGLSAKEKPPDGSPEFVDLDNLAGHQGRNVTYLYGPEYAMTFVTLGKLPSKDDPIYVFVGDDRRLVIMDHAFPGWYNMMYEQHVPTYVVTKDKVLSTLLETPVDKKCICLYKRGDDEWGGLAATTPINFSELRENVKVRVTATRTEHGKKREGLQ